MTKRVAIYARVSTSEQTTENQILDLRRFARERDWDVQGEYVDHGISGTRESRPALDRMMNDVRKRLVDIVLVWRFDRFARSVKHLAIFVIVAAMAALERDIIVERVRAGLQRARRQGKRIGRPKAPVSISEIRRLRAQGMSQRAIGRTLRVSYSTVCRMLQGD